jgi:hypothetical protein
MALKPYHLARVNKIKERARSMAKEPTALAAAENSRGTTIGEARKVNDGTE